MIVEISSSEAAAEEAAPASEAPSYTLTELNGAEAGGGEGCAGDEGGGCAALRLAVSLPRVGGVGEIDLQMGERQLSLSAGEGVYAPYDALSLPLPHKVDSEGAKCKFDKKKRVLTVTMPVRAGGA